MSNQLTQNRGLITGNINCANNEIRIHRNSTVNHNDDDGIRIQGSVVGNERRAPDNNDIFISELSHVCFNEGLHNDEDDPTGNGISMIITCNSDLHIDESTVSENANNGIYGLGCLSCGVEASNQSGVHWNAECGILFNSVGLKGGNHFSEDNYVHLTEYSGCDFNQGQPPEADGNIGGIVMLGDNNEVMIDHSTVSDNVYFGIRNYSVIEGEGRSIVEVTNNSHINDNGYTGISIIRPLSLIVNDSEVLDSGNNGIFALHYGADEDQNLVFNVHIQNSWIGGEEGSGLNGVELTGDILGGANPSVDILFDNAYISDSGEPGTGGVGVLMSNLMEWGEEGVGDAEYDIRFINDTRIVNSDAAGIEIQNTRVIDMLMQKCRVDMNDGAGLRLRYPEGQAAPDNILDCVVEGCLFEYNPIGVLADQCKNLRLIIRPFEDEETGEVIVNTFYDHDQFSVHIRSVAEAPTAFLIDRVLFDHHVPLGMESVDAHVKVEGDVLGWRGGENPDDIDHPTCPYATIRKCSMAYGERGVWLEEDEGEGRPHVYVRNNLIKGILVTGVEVDYSDANVPDVGTMIFNNTLVSEAEYENTVGVDLDVHGEARDEAALGDDCIYSNIFKTLEFGIFQRVDEGDLNQIPFYAFQCFSEDIAEDNRVVNCRTSNSVFENPDIHDMVTGQLKWNSPCINAGLNWVDWAPDERVVADSSLDEFSPTGFFVTPSDIGCTGGGYFAGILTYEHLNVGENEDVCDDLNDGEPLRVDEYLMNDVTIPDGETLTIGFIEEFDLVEDAAGTRIFSDQNERIRVRGGIRAEGRPRQGVDDPVFIYFTGHHDAAWYGFYIYSTLDANSEFNTCHFSEAKYGLNVVGNDNPDGEVLAVQNCVFDNNGQISVSGRALRGSSARLNVVDTDFINSMNTGATLINCSPWHEINQTGVLFSGCNFTDNGGDGSSSTTCGLYCQDANPTLNSCYFENNWSNGMYLSGSDPEMEHYDIEAGQGDGMSIKIANNGQEIEGGQSGYTGAEMRLIQGSYPDFSGNDIYDIDEGGDRLGILIHKSQYSNTDEWDAPHDFWGDANQELGDQYFYWGTGDRINYPDPADGPFTDDAGDLSLFRRARFLQRSGQYREAVACYWEFVNTRPNSGYAFASLHYIFDCVVAMNGDIDELRDEFIGFAEAENRDHDYMMDLRWRARKLSTKCLMKIGEYEVAMSEFREMAEDAPDEGKRIIAEINILAVQELLNLDEDNIDALTSIEEKIAELGEELEEYERIPGKGHEESDDLVPESFALYTAYPNPFNSMTNIGFDLAERSRIKLGIYDLNGRMVAELLNDFQPAGSYSMAWNASDMPSGTYICCLDADGCVFRSKLVLVR